MAGAGLQLEIQEWVNPAFLEEPLVFRGVEKRGRGVHRERPRRKAV